MESLIQLLLILTTRAQFNSESEREEALDLLRAVAAGQNAQNAVPPKPGPTNAPRAEEVAVDPGPVAEPVPPNEQPPPPTSPEVAGAAESNAFGQ